MISSDSTRASLLVRIRNARDQVAWGQFVEIYAPLVHRMARRSGLQDADAADLTQDVMRSVARSVNGLNYDPRKGTFRSWLYTVTRHAINRFIHAQRKLPRGAGDPAVQAWLEALTAPAEEPSDWDRDYQRQLLVCASERVRLSFEPSTWQAFWQTAVEGKSGKEVALSLGMSVGAVYIAKSRVLGRLRDEVRTLGDE